MQGFEVDAGGNLWVMTSTYINDETDPLNPVFESSYTLTKTGPDGAELAAIDIDGIPGYDKNQDYIQNFALDGEGNVYIGISGSASKISAFSGETGAHLFTVNEPDYFNELTTLGTGEVAYMTYGASDGKQKLKAVDFAARASVEKTYSGGQGFNDMYTGYGEYDFLYFTTNTLYGYKLASQAAEPVILFFDSGIEADNIRSLATTGDGSFIAEIYDYESGERGVFLLKPNLDPALGAKKVITLGGIYLDRSARSAAIAFNKASADARIAFKDYSEYNTQDDYNVGATRLDIDILGGNAPDIISLSSLSARKYASKGVFTDLYPLLDADEALDRGALFENILKMGEYEGKLTSVITAFSLLTTAGKKSVFGDRGRITAEELIAVADAHPGADIFRRMTMDDWMSYVIRLTLDDFVNWDTGVCSFDSPGFIGALELSKRFPKEIDYNNIDWQTDETEAAESLRNGGTLLTLTNIYGPRALRDARDIFGGDEDVVFVGFPTNGASGAVVSPQGQYAIAESSPNKAEAWSFISELLRNTEESGSSRDAFVMYTNRTQFEKRAAAELIPLAERDFSKGVTMSQAMPGGGSSAWSINSIEELRINSAFTEEQIANYHLTQEEADAVLAVIEGADRAAGADTQKISEIISEEIGAFASGAKSAEETAKVVQSRVQLFVSESK
jgi:ABC-type glycerol-3-phosphate transport system substrate-binding protein